MGVLIHVRLSSQLRLIQILSLPPPYGECPFCWSFNGYRDDSSWRVECHMMLILHKGGRENLGFNMFLFDGWKMG
jgi:hypothetical protein